jgi:hypothetical protein
MKRIIRVFPRRTKATPTDDMVRVGPPDLFDAADEVHISVTFSWDRSRAEELAREWRRVTSRVEVGGPAFGAPGGEFVPGRYLRTGYVVTSRGCPNDCWFCSVWRREGQAIRELPITDGHTLLDDNLLACSESHIRAVFVMLRRQKGRTVLTGGLEAARLQDWHVDLLRNLRPRGMYFAYDTAEDHEPLRRAGKMLLDAGWTRRSHTLCAYVLIGYPRDTFEAAEKRLRQTWAAGFLPYAMLYRNAAGAVDGEWKRFQRGWVRPEIVVRQLGAAA